MSASILGNRLVLDIETVPLRASLDATYNPADFSPPSNYGVDAAVRWHVKNEADWRGKLGKTASINPRLGRVLCVGTQHGVTYATEEAHEVVALESFWMQAAQANGYIVGWNSAWDLRFLLIRSMVHGVTPTVSGNTIQTWFRRYVYAPHFDCKAALLNWDVKVSGEGLDEWAKALGIAGKMANTDGGDVAWMYDEGQHDLIKQYCAQDVATTQAIFEHIGPFFGVE